MYLNCDFVQLPSRVPIMLSVFLMSFNTDELAEVVGAQQISRTVLGLFLVKSSKKQIILL